MLSEFLDAAIEAAQRAGALLMSLLPETRDNKGITFKRSTADLLTKADRMIEDLITGFLIQRFPGHGVLAEEGTKAAGDYRWIIDPLDGTTNFAYGVPLFVVSIALEHQGQVIAGVVYHPPLDEMFVAERGGGAFLWIGRDRQHLHVSATNKVADAVVSTGLPYDIRETGRNTAHITALARTAIQVRLLGTTALHLAYVAAGRFEAFWEPDLNPWDIAAGSLLVEEAGGRITDMQGGRFHPECRDVLASNGRIHEEMVALLGSA